MKNYRYIKANDYLKDFEESLQDDLQYGITGREALLMFDGEDLVSLMKQLKPKLYQKLYDDYMSNVASSIHDEEPNLINVYVDWE